MSQNMNKWRHPT